MAAAFGRTLDAAEVGAAELSFVDVYSCFPVVPKLACLQLGLPREASLSVTGDHAAFGGPMNTYTLFSVVAVAQRLREGGGLALVHGNGGFVTYLHAVLLSAQPHPHGYVGEPDPVAITPVAPPVLVPATDGLVTVGPLRWSTTATARMPPAFSSGGRSAGLESPRRPPTMPVHACCRCRTVRSSGAQCP